MVKPHTKVSCYGFFLNNDNDSIMKSNSIPSISFEKRGKMSISFYGMCLMNQKIDFISKTSTKTIPKDFLNSSQLITGYVKSRFY